jgi:predicted 3-demethylubiquinone-9 3-methyltransferase (glyoxalase superfamily)
MQITQKITPCLWFDDQAEEAVKFYNAIFRNSKIVEVARYGEAGRDAAGSMTNTALHGKSFPSSWSR